MPLKKPEPRNRNIKTVVLDTGTNMLIEYWDERKGVGNKKPAKTIEYHDEDGHNTYAAPLLLRRSTACATPYYSGEQL